MNDRKFKPKEFSKMIGVSVSTLQRWDRTGILKAHRTLTDRRYYTNDQYLFCVDEKKNRKESNGKNE